MSDDCHFIQAHMTAAYDRWQANREMKPKDFLESLSAKESFAVRIGNLNYQVENGGFSQYWGNSYAMHGSLEEVRSICRWLVTFARDRSPAEQEVAAEVLAIVAAFAEILGPNLDPNGRLVSVDTSSNSGRGRRSYAYMDEDDDQETLETEMMNRIEEARLDNRYYAVNDKWMTLAEAYFVATFK